jgi:LmbE family N-acetylglucosaminyl deacetylase
VEDLCTLLRRFRPQWVFTPHPDDSHPDHKYGYAFVVTALAQVAVEAARSTQHAVRSTDKGTGTVSGSLYPVPSRPAACCVLRAARCPVPVVIGAYLVHSPSWPSPPGLFLPLPLAPPAALRGPGHRWEVLPLSGPVRERKRQAVLAYTSQTAVLGGLLKSFARANELFERDPPSPFPARPPGAARAKVIE